MTSSPDRQYAIPWYAEADFDAIKALMTDEDIDFASYADWLKAAEELEASLRSQGRVSVRVPIDPATFRDFCERRNVRPDSGARFLYARLAASGQLEG